MRTSRAIGAIIGFSKLQALTSQLLALSISQLDTWCLRNYGARRNEIYGFFCISTADYDCLRSNSANDELGCFYVGILYGRYRFGSDVGQGRGLGSESEIMVTHLHTHTGTHARSADIRKKVYVRDIRGIDVEPC